ncbi:hypothetical protein N2152v2_009324 [Parachlorella kessleri]
MGLRLQGVVSKPMSVGSRLHLLSGSAVGHLVEFKCQGVWVGAEVSAYYQDSGKHRLNWEHEGRPQTMELHLAGINDSELREPTKDCRLLGLKGREMYLEPQVGVAYEELFHTPLEEGYSNVAKLGKEKLLFAAREGLRSVRGRVTLGPPETSIEPVLLAGAMALLEQVGEYQLVLDLAEEAQHLGAAALRSSNRETLRDFERDVTLATALAHCGLAREAFDGGQAGPGCARMEEALHLLRSTGAPPGALGVLGQAPPPLAPKLQEEISEALLELKAEALLGYLQVEPDSEQATAKRRQAVAALRSMVQQHPPPPAPAAAAAAAASGGNGAAAPAAAAAAAAAGEPAGLYLQRALPSLTSWEVCELLDWQGVAANKAAFGWYYPGLLEAAAVAHVVAGFTLRKPAWVETALKLLRTVRMESDVAIELAVCEVLLGSPDLALALLKEDERIGMALSGQVGPRASAAAAAADFPSRDGVMAFIRQQSPEGDRDLLPGLCLFVEKWLQRIAFPKMRDTAQLPPKASLVAYFADAGVETYLSRRDGAGQAVSPLGQLALLASRGSSAARAALAGILSLPARAVRQLGAKGALRPLQWLAAAVVLGAAVAKLGPTVKAAAQQRLAASLPPVAVQLSQPATPQLARKREEAQAQQQQQKQQQKQQQAQQQAQEAAAAAQQAAKQQAALSKATAEQVVKQWLRAKAEAMGPRHNTQPLSAVLADPMLSTVVTEVGDAQAAGWFWNIRPLHVKVDQVDCSKLEAKGGYAVVLATVEESADLWATNGKKGDSYKTMYQVEYTLVQSKGSWRIAGALVLGK